MLRENNNEKGFTFLELIGTLFILSIFVTTTLLVGQAWLTKASLTATSIRLIEDLRYAQAGALASGHAWSVQLSKYTPDYTILNGTTPISRVTFASGVNYYHGYLQMTSGRVSYDPSGNAQESGVVRLESGALETDITLYMGSGLQSLHELGTTP
ncbi:prepilin-type N-terminal cleavage/methylation domain-containing protein [Alicyclobacillus ferrooxydans]|uniref:prepilin-type N-terminal cleavage/methylation domain-containing protein n=1 Tax=Alicyclobacillus ferrooxydans TaxID=471514 RepID=UPI0006D5A8B4|nr:prepilin-type N-terminal cleavage/methylation domain-containing protein [Alicyclobacillus ferrooxydans]